MKSLLPFRASMAFALLIVFLAGCGGRAHLQLLFPRADQDRLARCRQDTEGHLILEIVNQGGRASIATTTQVEFPGHAPFLVPTRPIPSRQSTEIRVPVPEGCQQQPCTVTVTLDVRGEVGDQSAGDQRFQFRCRLHPFRLPQ